MPAELPSFDVRQIPFSVRGAWINLSPVVGLHQTARKIHLVSHCNGMHAVLSLSPSYGKSSIPAEVSAVPGLLSWSDGDRRIDATFDNPSTIRLRGDGLGLVIEGAGQELTPFTGSYLLEDPRTNDAVFSSYETGRRYRVSVAFGAATVVAAESLGTARRQVCVGQNGRPWELVIEELSSETEPYRSDCSFDEAVAAAQAGFSDYRDTIAGWREAGPEVGSDVGSEAGSEAVSLAAYVLWSATVAPSGFMRREAILMSKHWMDKVWSWDHCFNAIALAGGAPDLAWDQFMTPFDHQDDRGALPDSVTHSEVLFNFVKPPIHGWALTEIRRRSPNGLTTEQLTEAYQKLSRWSRFWLDSRRVPHHALPYYQHGNDSGWDNSTTFDHDRVIETADLAGFLAFQLGVLADLSAELGVDEEGYWRAEADRLITVMLEDLWTGEAFIGRHPITGRPSTATSLLNLLPLLVGAQLPAQVRDALASRIRQHLTAWGLATEPADSPHYEPDGYWRGPIWAPATVLIEDGLRRSGHAELADTISSRFRTLCERSGFAENFDALTGEGLRDRAYTWTASSYLLLSEAARQR